MWNSPDLPRFCGGAGSAFSATMWVRFLRILPDKNPDELNVDDACFLFTDNPLPVSIHVRHRSRSRLQRPMSKTTDREKPTISPWKKSKA